MALPHQKFREIVLQLLYSQDITRPDDALLLELMMAELAVSKKNVRLAQEKVMKIKAFLPKIDPLIASAAIGYDFDRIQIVTKNILRLAVFELFFDEGGIPPKASISEAIRLSRKFNTPESANFANALLDRLYKESLGQAPVSSIEEKVQELLESEQLAQEAAVAKEIEQQKPSHD